MLRRARGASRKRRRAGSAAHDGSTKARSERVLPVALGRTAVSCSPFLSPRAGSLATRSCRHRRQRQQGKACRGRRGVSVSGARLMLNRVLLFAQRGYRPRAGACDAAAGELTKEAAVSTLLTQQQGPSPSSERAVSGQAGRIFEVYWSSAFSVDLARSSPSLTTPLAAAPTSLSSFPAQSQPRPPRHASGPPPQARRGRCACGCVQPVPQGTATKLPPSAAGVAPVASAAGLAFGATAVVEPVHAPPPVHTPPPFARRRLDRSAHHPSSTSLWHLLAP